MAPGKNVAVAWEFEPFEGLEALWPAAHGRFADFLDEGTWSAQVRLKYRMKTLVTRSLGGIACNESVPPATAADYRCGDQHITAEGCNFKCLPNTCVVEHLAEKATRMAPRMQG